jgi:hypothetical protein
MQLTKEQIEFLDRVCFERYKWTLNTDGKIDVDGNVIMIAMNLITIPVKFGKVSESFYCSDNHLTSLEGCPDWVGKDFDCSENNLTSLEFAPSKVGGWFYCSNNPLKDYFKNIKEEDFKLWGAFVWGDVLNEYPFLIYIAKNYIPKERFIDLIKKYPKTKLYLK